MSLVRKKEIWYEEEGKNLILIFVPSWNGLNGLFLPNHLMIHLNWSNWGHSPSIDPLVCSYLVPPSDVFTSKMAPSISFSQDTSYKCKPSSSPPPPSPPLSSSPFLLLSSFLSQTPMGNISHPLLSLSFLFLDLNSNDVFIRLTNWEKPGNGVNFWGKRKNFNYLYKRRSNFIRYNLPWENRGEKRKGKDENRQNIIWGDLCTGDIGSIGSE